MKDWLGQEYSVGDYIIYAAGSGRSITMVVGEVVGFQENGSVKIQPLNSSRWKQHYGTDYFVDTRTGKRVDPWRTYEKGTHVKSYAHYIHTPTGNTVSTQEYNLKMQDYTVQLKFNDYEWVSPEWNDYIETRHEGPRPVVISVTENITKWTGIIPDGS